MENVIHGIYNQLIPLKTWQILLNQRQSQQFSTCVDFIIEVLLVDRNSKANRNAFSIFCLCCFSLMFDVLGYLFQIQCSWGCILILCCILFYQVTSASPSAVDSPRIVGGDETEITQFPYLAYIHIKTTDNKNSHCGGSIINNDWILTAAHCILYRWAMKTQSD